MIVAHQILEKRLLPWDAGFDVAYYLGQHREEAQAITDAYNRGDYGTVDAQLLEVSVEVKRHPPSSSNGRRMPHRAPAPIEPVKSSSSKIYRALDDPAVPYSEYKKRRDAGER